MKTQKFVVNCCSIDISAMSQLINRPWAGEPNTRIVGSECKLKRSWWRPWVKYWEVTHTVEFVK